MCHEILESREVFSIFLFFCIYHTPLFPAFEVSAAVLQHMNLASTFLSFFFFKKLHSQSFCTLHTYLNWLIYIAYSKGTFLYSYTNSTCGNWNSNISADFCTSLTQISSSIAQFTKSDARQMLFLEGNSSNIWCNVSVSPHNWYLSNIAIWCCRKNCQCQTWRNPISIFLVI